MPVIKQTNSLFIQEWDQHLFLTSRRKPPEKEPEPYGKTPDIVCWECGACHEEDCICVDESYASEDLDVEPDTCGVCGAYTVWECECPVAYEFSREPVFPKSWGYESMLRTTSAKDPLPGPFRAESLFKE